MPILRDLDRDAGRRAIHVAKQRRKAGDGRRVLIHEHDRQGGLALAIVANGEPPAVETVKLLFWVVSAFGVSPLRVRNLEHRTTRLLASLKLQCTVILNRGLPGILRAEQLQHRGLPCVQGLRGMALPHRDLQRPLQRGIGRFQVECKLGAVGPEGDFQPAFCLKPIACGVRELQVFQRHPLQETPALDEAHGKVEIVLGQRAASNAGELPVPASHAQLQRGAR